MKKIFLRIVALVLLVGFSASFQSCLGIAKAKAKREFTEEFKAIPPNFGQKGTVLLVLLHGRSSYDKYLKSAAKRYKGEIEFMKDYNELFTKYTDKEKYRFFFDYDAGSTSTMHNTQTHLSSSVTLKQFFVRDRVEDEKYKCGYESSYFGKNLKAYFENLEAKRLTKQQ